MVGVSVDGAEVGTAGAGTRLGLLTGDSVGGMLASGAPTGFTAAFAVVTIVGAWVATGDE